MAKTAVPAPVLDTRNGDQLVAQAIGSLPPELSDRSNANPAVVILEAAGSIADNILYQINQWPSAVIQKALSLVGITLTPAQPAIVTQRFTLSSPQQADTVIPKGSQVSTSDGSITFSTLSDLTITAYTAPAGTVITTAGLTVVNGSGTDFTQLKVGDQISTDKTTWYTIASISSSVMLFTTVSFPTSAASPLVWYTGPVTGTVSAQAITTGSATNVAAGTLTSLASSPAGVASTTNPAAASGGTDIETTANAIARAGTAFQTRDMAMSANDYAAFSAITLGVNGRAAAQSNTNGTAVAAGYVSVALLSPNWTTTTSVTAQERANVARDLNGRTAIGATTIDVAANINTFVTAGTGATPGTMFACALYRKSAYDAASTQVAAAKAINTYLSPNTYPWGRAIDPADLTGQLETLPQIDRVATINGVVAVGMNYTVVANKLTFTNASATVTGTASDLTPMTAGQTFILDSVNNAVYLVIAKPSSTTLTLDHAFAGGTNDFKAAWFTSQSTTLGTAGLSNLDAWYSLPYSSLSVLSTAPAASIAIVGSV